MRNGLVMCAAAVFAAGIGGASARPGVVTDPVNLRTGPGLEFPAIAVVPAGTPIDTSRCEHGWCRLSLARLDGYIAAAVVAPEFFSRSRGKSAFAPPPEQVWTHDYAPLFDELWAPPFGGGPAYTGPWRSASWRGVEWRYGLPGGHVPWYAGLGWRPHYPWH